jgi:hypothetical protein
MLTEMGAKPDMARALELLNQATGGGT